MTMTPEDYDAVQKALSDARVAAIELRRVITTTPGVSVFIEHLAALNRLCVEMSMTAGWCIHTMPPRDTKPQD